MLVSRFRFNEFGVVGGFAAGEGGDELLLRWVVSASGYRRTEALPEMWKNAQARVGELPGPLVGST